MKRSFYSSPVDHQTLGEWAKLSERLLRGAEKACRPDVTLEVSREPVFTYGIDVEETLLELEDLEFGARTVRIDLWSAIVRYGAICITVGEGIVRKERRALEKSVQKILRGETLIHESEGAFDRDERRIYGYRLDPADDRDRSTLADLLIPFDPPHYVGERWLLQGDDESIDAARYEIWPKTPSQVVQFAALTEEAQEDAWRRAHLGEGLLAVYPDDPALDDLVRHFASHDDLRRLPGKSWEYRVAIGRGRPEDRLVVVYDASTLPSEDTEWLFVV